MNHILKYFFRGLIILVPAVASVYVVYLLIVKLDGLMGIPIPGVGLAATVVATTLIGLLASTYFTRTVFDALERLFGRLPFVKLLYAAFRDLVNAFVGEKKSFDKPVMVELGDGLAARAVGFVTRESFEIGGLSGHVAVYFPQAYAFAGHVLVFPRSRVTPLEATSAEVMAFVVSGGVSGMGKKSGS